MIDVLVAGARRSTGTPDPPRRRGQVADAAHVERLIALAPLDAPAVHLGRTALVAAWARGDDDVARLLVRAGADRSAVDAHGLTVARVYGPAGEDVRPLEVHGGGEPGRLHLVLDVAVTAAAPGRHPGRGISNTSSDLRPRARSARAASAR
ncbi:MAG: ankyrin repeat domain-containing protein [bacterium]